MRNLGVPLMFIAALFIQCMHANADDTLLARGAHVYLERCSLCHGSKGLGEGPIAVLVHGYPNTNLKTATNSIKSVSQIVKSGTSSEKHHFLSPPWQDELTASDITAVTALVNELRSNFTNASNVLASVEIDPESIDGRKIYRARCESCHGTEGKGDGRMSRVIRTPPPSDLTLSALTHSEMIAVISAGGAAMGRSERMPPWGQELISAELISVANYLLTLRTTK